MTQVIIPLGGKGTRLEKFTSYYHKAMLPYKGKHLIEHIIDSVRHLKELEIIFVLPEPNNTTNDLCDVIENKCRKDNVNYKIAHQKTHLWNGPLGAIISAVTYIDSDVLIYLGDVLFSREQVTTLVDHNKNSAFAYQVVHDSERWCMIDNKFNLYDKVKGAPTDKALSGLYHFRNYLWVVAILSNMSRDKKIEPSEELQLSELIDNYLKDYAKSTLIEAKPLDFGTIEDYLRLTFKKERENHSIMPSLNYVRKSSKSISLLNEYAHLKLLQDAYPEFFVEASVNLEINYAYDMQKIKGKTFEEVFLFKHYHIGDIIKHLVEVFSFINNTFKTECEEQMQVNNYLERREGDDLKDYMKELNLNKVFTHGDLHLGNIMIDDKNNLKFIDPSGRITHSKYYDAAKMLHSFYNYNLVKMNLYTIDYHKVTFLNKHIEERMEVLRKAFLDNFGEKELKMIKIITMVMFKTICSCHKDNPEHQSIFYAIHKHLRDEIDAGDYSINIVNEVALR